MLWEYEVSISESTSNDALLLLPSAKSRRLPEAPLFAHLTLKNLPPVFPRLPPSNLLYRSLLLLFVVVIVVVLLLCSVTRYSPYGSSNSSITQDGCGSIGDRMRVGFFPLLVVAPLLATTFARDTGSLFRGNSTDELGFGKRS